MQNSNSNSNRDDDKSNITAVDSSGFPERMRLAMDGRSIREFASSASMSAGTLHNYLNNESLPTLDKLLALVNTSKTNLNWLATGNGSMYKDGDATGVDQVQPRSVDIKLLTMILECVEAVARELSIGMSVQKKCAVTSAIYDVLRDNNQLPVSREKIHRLIKSTFAP